MKAIRAGLDRYLNKENVNFSIITDREFKPANDALNAHLVELAREGRISSTKHKPAMILRKETAWPANTRKLTADTLAQYNASLWQTRARKHEGDDG